MSSGRASTSATDCARPCLTCTSLARSFRMSFMSWLPGTQRAEPAATMLRTSRNVSRIRGPRSTMIAEEHHLSPLGVPEGAVAPHRIVGLLDRHVAQLLEQGFQFVAAAVQIADDVKRPVFFPLVVPEWGPLDDSRLDLLGRVEDEDVREALPLQTPNGSTQLRLLLPDDVRPEAAVLPAPIPLFADLFGQVEDQCDRKAVVLSAKLDQRLAGFGLDVGGVHDGQMS